MGSPEMWELGGLGRLLLPGIFPDLRQPLSVVALHTNIEDYTYCLSLLTAVPSPCKAAARFSPEEQ